MKPSIEQQIRSEILHRGVRTIHPTVLVMPAMQRRPVELARGGTITLIIGAKDSELFNRIEKAAKKQDWVTLRSLGDAIRGQYSGYIREKKRLYKSLSAVPVFNEVRYKGRTLSEGIFLTDRIQVVAASILYNGGKIDHEQFKVLEYFKPELKLGHRALILVNQPILSKLERAILERVPKEIDEVNLAPGGSVAYTPVAAALATAVVGWAVGKAADWAAEKAVGDDAAANDRADAAADRQAAAAERQAAAAEREAAAAEREAAAAEREAAAAEREAAAAEREADAAQQQADQAQQEQNQQQQQDQAQQEQNDQGAEYYYVEPQEADADDQADAATDADTGGRNIGDLIGRPVKDFDWLDPTASAHALLLVRKALLTGGRNRIRKASPNRKTSK